MGCVSAFRRSADCGSCIVLMNISQEPAQADLSGYGEWTLAAALSVNEETVSQEGTTLALPAFGVAVLVEK